jgi:beta-lactamase superfamily II metal-dependent hydrolase
VRAARRRLPGLTSKASAAPRSADCDRRTGRLARLTAGGGRLALVAGLACLVAAAWQIRLQESRPPPSGFRLTVLDVGQGDAILLEVREERCGRQGPPEGDVDDQLRKLGA